MHSSRLVELGAIVASQHRLLCHQKFSADSWAADQYWVLSRARLNEWARALKRSESLRLSDDECEPEEFWSHTRPLLEEIFLSEICTRVWCATLSIVEERWHPGELDPIARSVFISSLESRRRALRLILLAKGLPGVGATSMNSLRMDCEIWTDYLLADLASPNMAEQYCFDRGRLRNACHARSGMLNVESRARRREGRMLALRYFLSTSRFAVPVCEELNSEIAAVILSCLPSAAFDGSGVQCLDFSPSSASVDTFSLDILSDLYGRSGISRYDARSGLKDRR